MSTVYLTKESCQNISTCINSFPIFYCYSNINYPESNNSFLSTYIYYVACCILASLLGPREKVTQLLSMSLIHS